MHCTSVLRTQLQEGEAPRDEGQVLEDAKPAVPVLVLWALHNNVSDAGQQPKFHRHTGACACTWYVVTGTERWVGNVFCSCPASLTRLSAAHSTSKQQQHHSLDARCAIKGARCPTVPVSAAGLQSELSCGEAASPTKSDARRSALSLTSGRAGAQHLARTRLQLERESFSSSHTVSSMAFLPQHMSRPHMRPLAAVILLFAACTRSASAYGLDEDCASTNEGLASFVASKLGKAASVRAYRFRSSQLAPQADKILQSWLPARAQPRRAAHLLYQCAQEPLLPSTSSYVEFIVDMAHALANATVPEREGCRQACKLRPAPDKLA